MMGSYFISGPPFWSILQGLGAGWVTGQSPGQWQGRHSAHGDQEVETARNNIQTWPISIELGGNPLVQK